MWYQGLTSACAKPLHYVDINLLSNRIRTGVTTRERPKPLDDTEWLLSNAVAVIPSQILMTTDVIRTPHQYQSINWMWFSSQSVLWTLWDSNPRPPACKADALAIWAKGPNVFACYINVECDEPPSPLLFLCTSGPKLVANSDFHETYRRMHGLPCLLSRTSQPFQDHHP